MELQLLNNYISVLSTQHQEGSMFTVHSLLGDFSDATEFSLS